ncbi:MAG: hypothetical protein JXD21_01100 [Candidatus Omnitrophica bacterium]|nr:hypothetical protein [Candidatus Omnitrophota bacterium]
MKIVTYSWIKGALCGLGGGGLLMILGVFGIAEKLGLDGIILFFASVPVLFVLRMPQPISEPFVTLIVFLYWIIMGAIAGWMLPRKKIGKITVTIFFVFLFFFHLQAKLSIEKDIQDAISALVESLKME